MIYLYVDALKAILFVFVFKATNVFRWRTIAAYLLFAVFLTILVPGAAMPEKLLMYASGIFAIYAVYGIIIHRIKSAMSKRSASAVPRQAVKVSITSLLSIYTIGYFFTVAGANEYISLIATIMLFFSFRLKDAAKNNVLWKALFLAAILHAAFFFSMKNILYPVYYVGIYVITILLFFEARDAFSIACIPEELRPGMIPAESIVHDGKKYVFEAYPYPSLLGIIRYVGGDAIQKRRTVASFFKPLQAENIAEIRKIAKANSRKIFLVQKKTDFLPFLAAGAIAAYFAA